MDVNCVLFPVWHLASLIQPLELNGGWLEQLHDSQCLLGPSTSLLLSLLPPCVGTVPHVTPGSSQRLHGT